jgi:hypothetical protein
MRSPAVSTLKLEWRTRPGSEWQAPRDFLDVVVDTTSLVSLCAARGYDLVSAIGWRFDDDLVRHRLGLDMRPGPAAARERLLVCPTCAGPGCGAVTVQISLADDVVTWAGFAWTGRTPGGEATVDLDGIGPYHFDRRAYLAALTPTVPPRRGRRTDPRPAIDEEPSQGPSEEPSEGPSEEPSGGPPQTVVDLIVESVADDVQAAVTSMTWQVFNEAMGSDTGAEERSGVVAGLYGLADAVDALRIAVHDTVESAATGALGRSDLPPWAQVLAARFIASTACLPIETRLHVTALMLRLFGACLEVELAAHGAVVPAPDLRRDEQVRSFAQELWDRLEPLHVDREIVDLLVGFGHGKDLRQVLEPLRSPAAEIELLLGVEPPAPEIRPQVRPWQIPKPSSPAPRPPTPGMDGPSPGGGIGFSM